MKNLYLTSIFCICASLSPVWAAENAAPAAADPCAEFRYKTRLNLTTSYGKLKYNLDYDRRALTRLGQQYGLIEPGMFASGLSLIGIDWSVTLNTVTRVAADDSICILPMSLDVFVGFQDPTVYIDRALNQESCSYQLVLRHEHQHQQVAIAALEYFLPRVRAEINARLGEVGPSNVASLSQTDAATARMNRKYIALIEPLVDKFKATLLHEQKKLDNRQNYEFESSICQNKTPVLK